MDVLEKRFPHISRQIYYYVILLCINRPCMKLYCQNCQRLYTIWGDDVRGVFIKCPEKGYEHRIDLRLSWRVRNLL